MVTEVKLNHIKLINVRASFVQLHEPARPKGYEDAPLKYSCNFLLDPKDEQHRKQIKEINADIKRVITEMWGKTPAKMKDIECFGKGEKFVSGKTDKPYEGYEGMYALAAQNSRRPLCMDRDKTPLTPDEIHKKIYSGCYVVGIVHFWAQDNIHGKAIRCSLDGVQFYGDGEEFSTGGIDADMFDDLSDGEMSDDLDRLDDDFDDDDIDF